MRLNDLFDRVVVINLDRRTDRLEEFDSQAQSIGLSYERHSAYDAEGKVDSNGFPLRGIVACTQSHLDIMQKAVDDGVEKLFIFEDDASFIEGFNEKLEKVWKQLPEDWEVFYGGLWLHQFKPYSEDLVIPVDSYSAHAYGMNRSALLEIYRSVQGRTHIDLELSVLNSRLKAYCAKPALVYQRPGYSDLDKEYRDVTDKYL
jgi:hypothetical protein